MQAFVLEVNQLDEQISLAKANLFWHWFSLIGLLSKSFSGTLS